MSNNNKNDNDKINIIKDEKTESNGATVKKTGVASAIVLFLLALAKVFYPENVTDNQLVPPVDTPYVQDVDEQDIEISDLDEVANEIANEKNYTFKSEKNLNEHFEKHGGEFSYKTAKEYEQGASKVVNNPMALHKLEEEDNDDVYYLESTNEFVIVSTAGYIRTYFKPSDGIDYFNRQ